MKFNSLAIHAGKQHDAQHGAHVTPIYQTSTFLFQNVEQGARRFAGEESGYIYSRLGNPNMTEVENKMAALEGGESALVTASGMAAISTAFLALLKSGDHVVAADTLYGCTFGFLQELLPQYGVQTTFVKASRIENVQKAMQKNTKIIYLETPANPTMDILDLAEIAQLAHERGAKLIVDNTFMTPYLQKPLKWGADLTIHSATKYIGGHGDVLAGFIVGSRELIDGMRIPYLKDLGGIVGPFDAWLLNRGLKTLGLRMERHCANGQKAAEYLEKHPLVEAVYYPGLPSSPYYELAKRQMDGFGAMISFELKGGLEAGKALMNHVKMIGLAVSLGCVDSLIQHPASMTHSPVPREDRLRAGITDGLIRFSVGIEDIEDIIEDLEQALHEVKKSL